VAQTPEGRVKDKVKKLLKAHGIWYYMPMQNGMGVNGIPDLICCWEGHFFAIETKAPGKINNLTPNQEHRIAEIKAAQGIAIVVDDPKQVEDFINGRIKVKESEREA
jgi:hypothetical protein